MATDIAVTVCSKMGGGIELILTMSALMKELRLKERDKPCTTARAGGVSVLGISDRNLHLLSRRACRKYRGALGY